jgi:hypothetical protein
MHILLLIILGIGFYFFVVRPYNKQEQSYEYEERYVKVFKNHNQIISNTKLDTNRYEIFSEESFKKGKLNGVRGYITRDRAIACFRNESLTHTAHTIMSVYIIGEDKQDIEDVIDDLIYYANDDYNIDLACIESSCKNGIVGEIIDRRGYSRCMTGDIQIV